ncbi:hypothetical protein D3C75_1231310 [compost metagenome]
MAGGLAQDRHAKRGAGAEHDGAFLEQRAAGQARVIEMCGHVQTLVFSVCSYRASITATAVKAVASTLEQALPKRPL